MDITEIRTRNLLHVLENVLNPRGIIKNKDAAQALGGPDKRSPATPDQLLPDGAAPAEPTRACPYCAEPIRLVAIKCKHCGSDLLTNPADLVGR